MGGNHSFWHMLVQLDMFGYPISLYYHDNSRRMKSMLGLIITAIVITLGTVQVVDSSKNNLVSEIPQKMFYEK